MLGADLEVSSVLRREIMRNRIAAYPRQRPEPQRKVSAARRGAWFDRLGRRDHLLENPNIVSGVGVQEQGCSDESVLQKQTRTLNIVVPDGTLQDAGSVSGGMRSSSIEKGLRDPPPTIILVDSEVIDLRLIPLELFHFDATDDLIIAYLEQESCARSEDVLGVVVSDELIARVEQSGNLSGVVPCVFPL